MNKVAAKKLQKEIMSLAHEAFTLDLYATGKQLCHCAEHLRQLIVVTDPASSRHEEKRVS